MWPRAIASSSRARRSAASRCRFEAGWVWGSWGGASMTAASQPFQHQQQSAGEDDQQRRDGRDGRRDVLADAGEHLARQRDLLGPGEEERDDDFVERSRKGKQRTRDHTRRDDRQRDAEER